MPRKPELSIIVPIYNVEQYLAQCLSSIAANSFANFEVVMVDDGSTDSSARIAREFTVSDHRFRLFSQVNRGNGHARNRAFAHSTAPLVACVDADDVIPKEAYACLVRHIRDNDVDFVAGSARRISGNGKIGVSHLHRRAIDRDMDSTNVEENPKLFFDTSLWNKVYRRDFLAKSMFPMPVGFKYEDLMAVTKAYVEARSVGITRQNVYYWRKRSDGSSITQSMHRIATLEDRYAMLSAARAHIVQNKPQLLLPFLRKCLDVDVRLTLKRENCANKLYQAIAFRKIAALYAQVELLRLQPALGQFAAVVQQLQRGDTDEAERLLGVMWCPQPKAAFMSLKHHVSTFCASMTRPAKPANMPA